MKNAGRIDHQPALTIEADGLRALGDVQGQLAELLVHGAAALHVAGQLRGIKRRNIAPALKLERLHVQCRQEAGTLGVLPDPDVAVLDKTHQVGHGLLGVKELPGQARAGLVHVEMHHAAATGKTRQLVSGTLVVIEHHQLGGALFDLARDLRGEGKVEDINSAAVKRGQVSDRLDVAMVKPQKFGLTRVIQPGCQRRRETVGAVAAMVKNKRLRVVEVGLNQETQGKNSFHGQSIY